MKAIDEGIISLKSKLDSTVKFITDSNGRVEIMVMKMEKELRFEQLNLEKIYRQLDEKQ